MSDDGLPDFVVVGANGAYWRDFGDFYSMCPVSTDNDPVTPVAWYERVGAERESSAADVDGAAKPARATGGHHESVGERQGRQPAPLVPAHDAERLVALVGTLTDALREILVIAAPAWSEAPAKDGWHEPYGDIASLAETALGESVIDARAALEAASQEQRGEGGLHDAVAVGDSQHVDQGPRPDVAASQETT